MNFNIIIVVISLIDRGCKNKFYDENHIYIFIYFFFKPNNYYSL